MSKIQADGIEAKRITLKGAKYTIALDAEAGGIWLTENGKQVPCVCIYMQGSQPVIGVHSSQHSDTGCAVALSIDDKGNGVIQIVKDGVIQK